MRFAMRARGFSLRTSPRAYRAFGFALGTMLLKAWLRAEEVHKAMLLRGFDGRFRALEPVSSGAGSRALVWGSALAAGMLWAVSLLPHLFRTPWPL